MIAASAAVALLVLALLLLWGRRRSVSGRRVQASFQSKNAMEMMKVRDMVDKHTPGWQMIKLLDPAVNDKSWFRRWKSGLDQSSACFVLFTDEYKEKANTHPQSALRMEAEAIRERLAKDKSFFVVALDGKTAGQGPVDFSFYLSDQKEMNQQGWEEFLEEFIDNYVPLGSEFFSKRLLSVLW